MQLKIIRIRGQCRGRSPTTRGPGVVSSQQSAVSSLQSAVWNHGTLELWNQKLEPGTGIRNPESGIRNHTLSLVKRRYGEMRKKIFALRSSLIEYLVTSFENQLKLLTLLMHQARDWPARTCPAHHWITRNRDNDRSDNPPSPAKKWRDERGMPVPITIEQSNNERINEL
ncbi:MAG: hypothetical protein KBB71_00240 [Lentimicrobiaceae bacterium]|nr:hypothetical protein [Lentimicrobiaceae bacterium]